MPTNNKMGDRDTNSTNSGEDLVISIKLNSIQNIKILWDERKYLFGNDILWGQNLVVKLQIG